MSKNFRKIEASEIQAGYQIIVDRTNWLNERGIHQWFKPIPYEVIDQRQQAGNFFGYWVQSELHAVVCLLDKSVSDWGNLLTGKYLYMATLASALQHKDQGYGAECVLEACEYSRKNGFEKIYLDCADNHGMLPRFYSQLGWKFLESKNHSSEPVTALMVKEL